MVSSVNDVDIPVEQSNVDIGGGERGAHAVYSLVSFCSLMVESDIEIHRLFLSHCCPVWSKSSSDLR